MNILSSRAAIGIYLASYFIALGLLTADLLRITSIVNQTFIESLLTGLQTEAPLEWITDPLDNSALLPVVLLPGILAGTS